MSSQIADLLTASVVSFAMWEPIATLLILAHVGIERGMKWSVHMPPSFWYFPSLYLVAIQITCSSPCLRETPFRSSHDKPWKLLVSDRLYVGLQ